MDDNNGESAEGEDVIAAKRCAVTDSQIESGVVRIWTRKTAIATASVKLDR